MKALRSLMKKVRKGEGGFTLIELLIVIIILGILAAVVAFNVGGFLGAGTEESAKTEAASLQTAIIAAMATCSVSTVNTVSVAHGSVANITLVDNATGDEGKLSHYLQSNLQGTYSWDSDGLIKAGATYIGGGKTCTLLDPAAANVWNCTST